MPRLIEIDPPVGALPAVLDVVEGDVLRFPASGGRVRSGAGVVDLLGAFVSGVLGIGGGILVPAGAPDAVLFRALRPGVATIEVLTGDPWRSVGHRTIDLTVTARK